MQITSHLVDRNCRPAALVVAEDITERRPAESKMRESEERFRTAFEHAPLGMCLTGLDGRFLQVNSALWQMFGYSERELLDGAWQKPMHPGELARSKDAVVKLVSGQIPTLSFEKRYLHKDRNVVWARLSISMVRDERGQPSHFISHLDDITKQKQLEMAAARDSEERNASWRSCKLLRRRQSLPTAPKASFWPI